MISKVIESYCENYEEIENYEEAISSDEIYDCHHRLEIDGDIRRSRKELIALGLYYHRPADELIFLTHSEHRKLHNRNQTAATLKKMSEAQKGDKNPLYGSHHSEETKKKISDANKGKQVGNKNPLWKGKVLCVETGKVYECGYDAERELGINNIGRACKEGRIAGGYHWKYY